MVNETHSDSETKASNSHLRPQNRNLPHSPRPITHTAPSSLLLLQLCARSFVSSPSRACVY